ncbi:MAG: iron complex outerrane recepter protein [Verrucomicrobiota bacterium]
MIRNVLHTFGSFRTALVAAIGIPLVIAGSAYAQNPAPAPAPANTEATTERVIVTGSYIPTAETESALPVTVYTAEVLKKQGANTPVEGLRQLPSFVGNAATENDSNGGNGSATINLRGIGSVNTLILVNGRRTFNFNDINALAIGSISRTEVLKDGASAVYGSDGVAGVVNFILLNGPGEKPYEGAELYALYGNTTESDAHVRQVYLRGGVTGLDGKVSIAAVGEYYSRANLFSRDRFKVAGTGNTSNVGALATGWGGPNGNSPTFAGRVSVSASVTTQTIRPTAGGVPIFGQLVLLNLSDNSITPDDYRRFEPLGTAVPPGGTLPGDFATGQDPSRFNFRAFTPAIPGMEKAMYMVTGRYKIFGDGLQLYGDVMYSHITQNNGLAGAPFLVDTASARVSEFNPFGNNLASVRYRSQQELANRRSFFDKDFNRYVAGINGDFNFADNNFISRLGYDAGFVYERFKQEEVDSGDLRNSYIDILTEGNLFNPFIGQFAPVSGTAPTYNNTNPGGAEFQTGVPIGTAAFNNNVIAADWTNGGASYVGHSFFYERDQLYDAKFNAHLFPKLWNGGIDLAAGYEHREVNQKQIPDPVQASNDQLGFNQAPLLKFRQEVDSYFFELGIPIITSTMNVPWVKSLDLDIAWRREEFTNTNLLIVPGSPAALQSTFVNENPDENFKGSPRVSLRYQPVADVTFRASWGQSYRAPSPAENFQPVFQNFPVLFDPITRSTLQPPNGVYGAGSTDLVPETTDAYSVGIVWTPKFLPGFTMTVDAYQLFTTALILSSASQAQVLLSQNRIDPDIALGNVDPDGRGCGLGLPGQGGPNQGVTRDPARNPDGSIDTTGVLDCVDALSANGGKRHVTGLDVTAVYELPTERWGKFTFSGGWNHFFTWKAQPGQGQPFNSFLGNYNNGTLPLAPGAIPWNKGFLRGEWEWHHFDFVATGNYIGDFRDDAAFYRAFATLYPGQQRTVPSYITLDMQLSYEWVKPPTEPAPYVKESKDSKNAPVTEAATASIWQRILWGTKLTVGVNDVFDRYPPSVLGAFNDNYDTSLYTIRNRYWYVSLTKKF